MEPSGAERVFHEVADLESFGERAAYYARHGVSETVRVEVESLLRFDAAGEDSVRERVTSEAATLFEEQHKAQFGQWGAYKMIREIGRGGMGAVYLAERVDGEVEQQVAVKLLQQPHWGMATGAVVLSRFLRERQILASLSHHPGIAQLLDAGHTVDGQPYLVMEYVDGTPIDVYLRGKPLREKLEVFLQVCEAVAYAHQNLIIHRDLKPSNILVNAQGRAKLLDFGIAKVLVDLEDFEGRTVTRERMLTPEFASPEQVTGAPQTTATDVYSLGAVLYQLLTGRSPHSFGSGTSGEKSARLEVAICEVEPERARKVNPAVPMDLDCVVHMALRKEPERRYRSVEALLEEIRAFLERRPVRARGDDWWYRTDRFVRRYWVPVTAAVLAVGGLSTGLVVAARERAVAERRFAQVRQLANRFFELDREIRAIPGTTKVRQSVVSSSMAYLAGLEAEVGRDVELGLDVGRAYLQVAEVQGVPVTSNLGDPAAAEQTLLKAAGVVERVLQWAPGDVRAQVLAAEIGQDRMILYDTMHRTEDSLREGGKAAGYAEQLLASSASLPPPDRQRLLRVLSNAALAHLNQHRNAEGIRYARMAAEQSEPGSGAQAQALSLVANGLRFQGELDEALVAIRKARAVVEELVRKSDGAQLRAQETTLFAVRWREGVILGEVGAVSLGRWEEAAQVLREAMALTERTASQDAADVDSRIRLASAARELVDVLAEMGKEEEALQVYDAASRRLREARTSSKVTRELARLEAGAAGVLLRMKRMDEAARQVGAADARLRAVAGEVGKGIEPGGEEFAVWKVKADWEAAAGRREKAAGLYRDLVMAMEANRDTDPDQDLRHAMNFSEVFRGWVKVDPQAGVGARWIALWKGWEQRLPGNRFVARQRELAKVGR
jgi:tetratricopeptide (TPR) repeat protein